MSGESLSDALGRGGVFDCAECERVVAGEFVADEPHVGL
jgi:hypothetical protein